MKIRLVVVLVGLAIGITVPVLAQEKETTPSEGDHQLVDEFNKKIDGAYNNNDAAALAAFYAKDAVLVTNTGPIYGREEIEKYYKDLFQKMHFSNYLITPDQYSPHPTGTAGKEDWANGEWSLTVKGPNWGPKEVKGFWSAVHVLEGDVWKNRMVIGNTSPAPSPTATPSNK
jgi:Domain of unknown function (DUF4440)